MEKHLDPASNSAETEAVELHEGVEETPKSQWQRLWPVIACGAGLFSDGYLNGVIGSVSTILEYWQPDAYDNSPAQTNVGSIAFAGQVVGQLVFGYTSDRFSRKWSLLASTLILILFAILSTAAYGANGSLSGLFAALTAYRFFLGIGIGGEYPAGSVGCAESTGELKAGTRNRWFILFTNVQIDLGFLVAAIVPMIVILITTERNYETAWRVCLGLGIIPPLSLLYLRLKLSEPESFKRHSMVNTRTPYWLAIKFYGYRLLIVSVIWFIYDFSSYSFGIFSSRIVANLLGPESALWVSFGWNTLITFFYMPGAIAGSWLSDRIGPKKALAYAVLAQAIVGFIMAGCYGYLAQPQYVGGFVVVYGLFLSLGELGPGDNIGLLASKTCATAIRGKYYGIAAAFGKIGAYIGTEVLGILYKQYKTSDPIKAGQYPFFISSALCVLSAFLALFLLPDIGQDTIDQEDARFRAYLEQNGFDTSKMGTVASVSRDQLVVEQGAKEN
ncbi:hypothetical protein AMS68_007273 [Peltaster fructicola]|uniref:Major facilitator superfamily (MFS) profile domain-containing protein n=1 Tax=Peltaster fructicola TaxID=286661 RepID=A0A6H0Y471_9PEZI|nr:hypothetical protein AMS68_007273 [Peltaster fructicola]